METSEAEKLRRLLQEAEQRAEEASHRAEEASHRAEEASHRIEELEHRVEKSEHRAEESEKQMRPTTLNEYLTACHHLVFSQLIVETNRKLTSKGSITNPRHKLCPTNLRPWPDFIEQQRTVLGTLYSTFPAENRLFESQHFLATLGQRIAKRKISDEKVLEWFQHNSVEDPTHNILEEVGKVEEACHAFDVGKGIIFENHPHAISDLSEEVAAQQEVPSTPQQQRHQIENHHQLRPDQICVYRTEEDWRTMIYISEYKPPHKLTLPHLRLGLHPMDIYREVVNRKTIPTSIVPEAQFQYHSERLTAAAITQTYHYMIEGGLEYGLLTTGEAIVFLKVDWREPETLLYHLTEPKHEVMQHPTNTHACTAVAQYLAFSLMALGSPGQRQQHGQEERLRAKEKLNIWAEDFETTVRQVPEGLDIPESISSAYVPTSYENVDRTPYLFRKRKKLPPATEGCHEGPSMNRSPESSDDDRPPDLPDTPSPTERRTRQSQPRTQTQQEGGSRRSQRIQSQQSRGGCGQKQAYCTQGCLLGLVRGGMLDQQCPNVALHHKPSGSFNNRHPVGHAEWLQLLYAQLKQSLDDGIEPLGVGGARGVLFRVTLLEYGYTFISKGTVSAFVKDLEHEGRVYRRLRRIQGINVPVFLGTIDLRDMNKVYYYDHRVYVIHLTFLSWGGHPLHNPKTSLGKESALAEMAARSLSALHREGVLHRDVRSVNALLSPETNEVMFVDFERSLLLESPRRRFAPVVPNKRRVDTGGEAEGEKSPRRASGSDRRSLEFRSEMSMARGMFI